MPSSAALVNGRLLSEEIWNNSGDWALPALSTARTSISCSPLPSARVLSVVDQLVVPEALIQLPPSTRTCTLARPLVASEAVPARVTLPLYQLSAAGEVMRATGATVSILKLNCWGVSVFPSKSPEE